MRKICCPALLAATMKCSPTAFSTELRKRRSTILRSLPAKLRGLQAAAMPSRLNWMNSRRCISIPIAGVETTDNAQFAGDIAGQQLVQLVDLDEDQLQATVAVVIGEQLLQICLLAPQPLDGRGQLLIKAFGQFAPLIITHQLAQTRQKVLLQTDQTGLDTRQRMLAAPGVGNVWVAAGFAFESHGRCQTLVAQDLETMHGSQHGGVLELVVIQVVRAKCLPSLL